MPDLTEVTSVLALERLPASKPSKADFFAKEKVLLERALKDPFYGELHSKLSEIDAKLAPRRFLMLDDWLQYLASPPRYKQQLAEYEQEVRLAQAQHDQDMAKLAKQERERRAQEMRILASVPSLGSKCRQAIADWQSATSQIERAAVAGHPSTVKAASARRDSAARRACTAGTGLRSAVELYRQQGMVDAAQAVSKQYAFCLRICN
jgi:hypothetical protein